ncbi:hypothetical protein OH77DRAFT_1424712 [Trametes cingulata]|nr:hypothetical protein OH77DRAFT_1424712 [Trametes cingulata]
MPATRDSDSPFDGSRFALREDSRTWPSEPRHSRKVTRFASTTSVSSDRDEPDLPPLRPVRHDYQAPVSLPAALTVLLLAIALIMHLSNSPHPSLLQSLKSRFTRCADPVEPSIALTPAVKVAVEELVLSTIRAQQASHRAPPDYALRAHGGRVALPLTSGPRGSFLSPRDDDPGIAIDDDVHAGKCWEIKTLPSQLGIRLARVLRPTHISVEHLPNEVAVNIDQAPRNMTLWGVVEGNRNQEIYASLEGAGLPGYDRRAPLIAQGLLWAPLASFVYDINAGNPVQTFPVLLPVVDSMLSFGVVAVEVLSNWGGSSTCLYRVRIHGDPL